MPLIQVAANEAEEIFEAKSGGPQIERARGDGLPGRDVMMLAKKCRIIAILTQDLSNACGALWNFRQIHRKARGNIHDIACRYSRSEGRRVGNECDLTWRFLWSTLP